MVEPAGRGVHPSRSAVRSFRTRCRLSRIFGFWRWTVIRPDGSVVTGIALTEAVAWAAIHAESATRSNGASAC